VLPWNSDQWDVKVLDPSCGSGIFLVKAFQRLIHRWRRSHPGRDPHVSDIKPILANNIVGVDKHEEAVRVACFSLYLVMADAIEPRHYLKRDKVFPRLRGTRLLSHDFFDETKVGIRTLEDAGTYDLVIGNAPWGEDTIETLSEPDRRDMGKPGKRGKKKAVRTLAEAWATNHRWPVANKDMGPLFLPKGAALLKDAGSLAMIQSASVLHLRSQDAGRLREQLFERFSFDEITNLSLVRDSVFSRRAYAAAAVLVFRNTQPKPDDELIYLCPKEQYDPRAQHTLALDPQDVHRITHAEAARVPHVWTALHLGGRRDLDLLLRLSRFPSLADHKEPRGVKTRQGVIPGDKKKILDGRTEIQKKGKKEIEVTLPDLRGTHYLQTRRFPEGVFLTIDQEGVPIWDDPRSQHDHSTNFDAFHVPQLLVKMSYSRHDGRMRAARVHSVRSAPWGIICKKTYFSVHAPGEDGDRLLDAACVAFNSKIATWYLALTSSRIAFNRPEALVDELVGLPIPEGLVDLRSLRTFEDVDRCAERLYGLTEADTLLVDDCVRYKLPQAQSESRLSGYHPTRRASDPAGDGPDVVDYADYLVRVLRATFGRGRAIGATVYEEDGSTKLPVRLVVIELGGRTPRVDIETMQAGGLMESLHEFYRQAMQRPGTGAGQRVAFLFDRREGTRGVRLCIVKPDQQRYWMRSVALHDADEISGAILMGAERRRTGA
jgi:N-6 DNA Methylase